MPVLPCPLGARCTDGEDGATWKSVDITFEQAQVLVADHVKFAHQNVASVASPSQLKAELLSPTIDETCDSVKKLSSLLTKNVSDLKDFAQASIILEIRGLKISSATSSTPSAASTTSENINPFKLLVTPSCQIYMAPATQPLSGEKELAVPFLDGKENKNHRNTTKVQEGNKNEDDTTLNETKASPSSVDLMDWETSPQSVHH